MLRVLVVTTVVPELMEENAFQRSLPLVVVPATRTARSELAESVSQLGQQVAADAILGRPTVDNV
jgi:hypothetical protein